MGIFFDFDKPGGIWGCLGGGDEEYGVPLERGRARGAADDVSVEWDGSVVALVGFGGNGGTP
jgi:hypothetical protein